MIETLKKEITELIESAKKSRYINTFNIYILLNEIESLENEMFILKRALGREKSKLFKFLRRKKSR